MINSPIPADHEISVLVIIKNGAVISETVLPQRVFVASIDEFIELAAQAGKLPELAAAKE